MIPSKALRFNPAPEVMKDIEGLKVSEQRGPVDPNNDKTQKIVWVKDGDKLLPKHIVIGKTDGIHTAIIEGLNAGEEIVTGILQKTNGDKSEAQANGNGESSPFMPKRPGDNKKK